MEIVSRVFEKDDFQTVFHKLVDTIRANAFQVEILYGAAWGNEVYGFDKDWIPEGIKPEEIMGDVKDKVIKEYGTIGEDDFFITMKNEGIEILVCHERDLHITYKNDNTVLQKLKDVINSSDWLWIRQGEKDEWKRIEE